jgi:predicted Zn-dependent protease with MMP-like domain
MMVVNGFENGDDPVGAIFDALEADNADRALELAEAALGSPEGEDPVIRYLGGVALGELDRAGDAVEWLRRAVELDADDPEYRVELAHALFRSCRFEEAGGAARGAIEADDTHADAHEVTALLLERQGRFDEADEHFERAARLDSERNVPSRMSRERIELEIVQAGEQLPERFRERLAEVVVTVEDLPSDEILLESDPPLDPELLGLFVGVALTERDSFSAGGDLPPRILLFQRNLERFFPDVDELRREIVVTLRHELGHYLGFDEQGLEDIDLA